MSYCLGFLHENILFIENSYVMSQVYNNWWFLTPAFVMIDLRYTGCYFLFGFVTQWYADLFIPFWHKRLSKHSDVMELIFQSCTITMFINSVPCTLFVWQKTFWLYTNYELVQISIPLYIIRTCDLNFPKLCWKEYLLL